MKKKILDRRIYPDFEKISPKKINEILKGFDVKVNFLFDDGIEFIYDNLEPKDCPGDICFYNPTKNIPIFNVLENFGALEFYLCDSEDPKDIFLSIPICDVNPML